MSERNARIKSVSLGVEDHGILTAFLHLDYGGSSQGFGGYCLDAKGANYCAAFIRGCLDTLGLEEWSRLPGTVIRVRGGDGPGLGTTIEAIGHAIDDRWFYPKRVLEKLEQEAKP
jgi:hypothetical protein